MLETELRELFERQASGHQPAAAITSQQVIRQGRSRLRISRATAVAAPMLAAAVVPAVVVATTLSGAEPGSRPPHHRSAASAVAAAPKYFDPLRPYPAFGWLPGTHVISGQTGTTTQILNAGQPDWMLTVHAGGQCSAAGRILRCNGERGQFVLMTQLPDIDGLPAYWTVVGVQKILVFEYARDGWAELTFSDLAEAVRVAGHISFGSSAAPPVSPVQLTGLPGWRLRYESFLPMPDGTLAAGIFGFASGAAVDAPGSGNPANYPVLFVSKAALGGTCSFTAGQSSNGLIAGYSVTITRVPAGGEPAVQELCAADANGLRIDIFVNGNNPAIDVTQVFAHLRLLGPDPAQWTTKPVG
jgi:hypothetical protein